MGMTNLFEFAATRCRHFESQLALQHRPRYRTVRWTHRELLHEIDRLGAVLAARDVAPGDRVMLLAENSPSWVAAFFAIVSRGAVVVPLNPKSPPEQIRRLLLSAEPKLALHSVRTAWPIESPPAIAIDSSFLVIGAHSPTTAPIITENDLAEIIYTSGTTGEPKGVMLTHRNLLANVEAVQTAVPLSADDHVLTVLPLFHVFGQMTGLLCPLRAGCAVTFLPAPTSRALRDGLTHTPATHLVVVPEVMQTIMDRLETRLGRIPGWVRPLLRSRIRARISPTLRTIVAGGAPLDPVLEEKWWSLGFEVLQGYGLTETSPVISANTREAHRVGSVGKPVPGVEVRISDDGEVQVRGENVMQGYYRSPEQTTAAFTEGWFRTGDGGRLDDDGFLFVFGRRKYMILGPGGENVFPEDIEAELNRLDGITDSAVIGLQRNGRKVIHAALLCDLAHAADRVAEANRHLAPHQQIMSWSVWPDADFPRSVTRKVKKEEVIRRLSSETAIEPAPSRKATPLQRLLAELTGAPPASLADSARLVADLGLDSLLRIELVTRIEDQFGKSLEEVQITPQTTVGQLQSLLDHASGAPAAVGRYPRWSLSRWARALRPFATALFLRSWISPFCRLRIGGMEYLTELGGPVIFMANHRSYLDSAVATFALPERFRSRLAIAAATRVLYRQYRWAVPLGELTLNAFPFPTGVDENIRPGLDMIGHLLDDDWNVLIFPEGQMNRVDGSLQPLKGGTGVLAQEMGVPIVPMAIEGTEKIMPPDTLLPRNRAEVIIRFGAPITVGPGESYEQATVSIQRAIEDLLRRDVRPAAPDQRSAAR